jgi:predicted DNA-binding transcriptional regulator YafY
MRYFSASRNKTGRREVDPYFLRFAGGGLYLIGHCDLRKEVRMFALERIRSIALTIIPIRCRWTSRSTRTSRARLAPCAAAGASKWICSFRRKPPSGSKTRLGTQETKLQKGGRLKMTLKVADNEELVGWILSFGGELRVVQPDALRQKMLGEANSILHWKS